MSWNGIKGFLRDGLLAVAIAFVVWFVWIQFMAPRPKSSGPAPAFALQNLVGQEVTLAQHEEGIVVLNFWFTSCPPCRHEIPQLAAFHTANPEVPFYGVSVDRMGSKRLAAMSKKLGINYPVLQDTDGAMSSRYGVSLFPTTIVINDGEIVSVRMGEVDQQGLEAMVKAAK